VKLIACANCHTQYDVSDVIAPSFPCRCGEVLENKPLQAVDARISRCAACGAQTRPDLERCEFCGASIVRDERKLSLICPECYARNADASRFCTACGVHFAPQPVRVEGHELPCPACGALMPPTQVGGLSVNECRGCRGLWVPGESFDLLVSRAAQARRKATAGETVSPPPRVTGANPARQRVQYRSCPECNAHMHRRNYRRSSGVIIDVCHQHGTWLDADELEQIAGFILSGGRTSTLLEIEPEAERAKRAAAAAFARARAAQQRESIRRDRPRTAGGLVELLLDVFTS
jgi:Zn-finger nucleic acid-binding protein